MSDGKPSDPEQLLRYGIKEGVDAQNKTVFLEVFADPVELLDPMGSESIPVEQIWQEYQIEKAALPDLAHNIHQTWHDGQMVFASYSCEAKFEGEFVLGEDTVIEPTGETMTISGLMQARVENGQITGWTGHWNQLDAFQQVGIIPPLTDLVD